MKIKAGTCYEASIKAMYQLKECGSIDWLLCHGIVTGCGGIVAGYKYGHAWLELDGVVIDVEQNVNAIKTVYYSIGKISYVKRYDFFQMNSAVLKYENYGPWDSEILKADVRVREKIGEYYEFHT